MMDFIVPTSLYQILVYVLVFTLLVAFLRSKGKFKIGPIEYSPAEHKEIQEAYDILKRSLVPFIEKATEMDKQHSEDILKNREAIHTLLKRTQQTDKGIKTLCRALKQLRLDSLKTQILLQATDKERKNYLFDEYKKLGGNSWMNEWIKEYNKQEVKHGVQSRPRKNKLQPTK